ncbi:hypothetical protein P4U07_13415 [Bacillus mycoides]|uniref:hypothetical protein n=1 Tax=Bacillus mycoides TaxID=1405 RepID=UPI002E24BB30|nr:hypothetical protein [Bacillus mycoides]
MDLVVYQVLLPQKFWEQANNEEELNQMIKQYFSISYPKYKIQEISENGKSHVAICTRED